ncbi:DUF1788 domain-containing protein [Limnobacter sp. P1]|uniref:DUF1788 domain-containing protein n=1 Tax=Limnobacter olei TaxID=3031298 RepID=UPI0023AF1797|nr:DUF1788 domain-containing protein [Limnobacter sp. P1]
MDTLDERLNRILPTLTSEKFRENRGLGNEVPFYAFDYPAQAEPRVREHIDFLVGHLNKVSPPIRVARVHLFEVLMSMLDERDFYSKAVSLQESRGGDALLKQLKGPLKPEKVAEFITKKWPVEDHDVYLIDGVGSAYPIIRTHSLLNVLQPHLGLTPLVMFFPGEYDGQSLRLFGLLGDTPYYRAFRLVD